MQKYGQLRYQLRVKGLVICLFLGCSGSILQIRTNMIKVGSKSWLLTCSSNITQSLPSSIGSYWLRQPKRTKIQQTLVTCQRFVVLFLFGLVWSGSILQFRQNIIKAGSKSCLVTCSSNMTLSRPSYNGSALKRKLNFCNGYLSTKDVLLSEVCGNL